jgi:hypothetical protein
MITSPKLTPDDLLDSRQGPLFIRESSGDRSALKQSQYLFALLWAEAWRSARAGPTSERPQAAGVKLLGPETDGHAADPELAGNGTIREFALTDEPRGFAPTLLHLRSSQFLWQPVHARQSVKQLM